MPTLASYAPQSSAPFLLWSSLWCILWHQRNGDWSLLVARLSQNWILISASCWPTERSSMASSCSLFVPMEHYRSQPQSSRCAAATKHHLNYRLRLREMGLSEQSSLVCCLYASINYHFVRHYLISHASDHFIAPLDLTSSWITCQPNHRGVTLVARVGSYLADGPARLCIC